MWNSNQRSAVFSFHQTGSFRNVLHDHMLALKGGFLVQSESFQNKQRRVELVPLVEPGSGGLADFSFALRGLSPHPLFEHLPSPNLSSSCRQQAIGGGAPRSLMDQFAEVLFSLNKHCFSLLSVWLKEALQPPGFPSLRVTTEQKHNFSQQMLR